MKAIVIYKSKTGYTQKYAEWIAEELGCDIKENASLSDIVDYDTVICGGGVYAGMVNGAKLIVKNLNRLSGKKLILFAVGASKDEEKVTAPLWNRLLTEEQQKNIACFYLRGGFDFSKLKGFDKLLMSMMKKQLQQQNSNPDDGLFGAFDNPVDYTERENIDKLIEYAKGQG